MIDTDILNLEQQLLREEVRSSAESIAEILADGFVEFCSSGRIYRYTPRDVFPLGRRAHWEIIDFQAKELADGVVLATYRLMKHDEPNEALRVSLRSSIWKAIDGKWKMVFHQGTPSGSPATASLPAVTSAAGPRP
jgi:hypothetical protein